MEYRIISILLELCVIYSTTDGKSSTERKNRAGAGSNDESLHLIRTSSENIQMDPSLITNFHHILQSNTSMRV